jgi:NAD(P)-dependent dehydrogenase (short-subunit alcohol dehydrogenase family)
LNKHAALVTGASSGIGQASAVLLAQRGFQVFASVRRQVDATRLSALGLDITPVFMDVSDQQSISAAKDVVTGHLPDEGLYALVNNAGIGLAGPVEYLGPEILKHIFEVNVLGKSLSLKRSYHCLDKQKGVSST